MAKNPFNTSAQNLVYQLEVGMGPAVVKGFLYVLTVGLIGLLFLATQYQGFKNARAMEQAQLARNFSETGRLTTQVIRPGDLRKLQENGKWQPSLGPTSLQRQPDLVNAPLYPMVLGTVFKVLGTDFPTVRTAKYPPEQWVIIPLNMFFCMLAGLFLYLAGLQLFSPRVATMAVSVYFLTGSVWAGAVEGTELSLVALLAAVALWSYSTLLKKETETGAEGVFLWSFVAVASVSLTALFLTRYATIVLIPGYLLLLFLIMGRKAILPAIATLAVFALGVAPWMLRNFNLSGEPFGFAPIYAVHDNLAPVFMRSFYTVDDAGFNLFRDILGRILASAETGFTFQKFNMANGLVLSLAIATFFYGFQRPSLRHLRWVLLTGFLGLILAAGLFGETQYDASLVLTPIVILYGCAFFFLLLDRMKLGFPLLSQILIVGFVMIQSLPLVVTLMPPKPSTYPPYFTADIQLVTRPFEPTELICSDMPWATAWYGDRTTLYLPANVDQFFQIHDTVQPVSALYLTLLSRDQKYQSELLRGNDRSWKPIMDLSPLPPGWPLRSGFPIRGGDSVILADRNRW